MLQECFSTAIKQGDKYILNGSKTLITKWCIFRLIVAAKKTDPADK
jgi:alkylation response protein AidB-like acyl-CoA dehydrogenase